MALAAAAGAEELVAGWAPGWAAGCPALEHPATASALATAAASTIALLVVVTITLRPIQASQVKDRKPRIRVSQVLDLQTSPLVLKVAFTRIKTSPLNGLKQFIFPRSRPSRPGHAKRMASAIPVLSRLLIRQRQVIWLIKPWRRCPRQPAMHRAPGPRACARSPAASPREATRASCPCAARCNAAVLPARAGRQSAHVQGCHPRPARSVRGGG